jgi:hypothetical protein
MFTGQTNPLIGIQAVDSTGAGKTPYFVQAVASDDSLYIGPTSASALRFNSIGEMYSPRGLTVAAVTANSFVFELPESGEQMEAHVYSEEDDEGFINDYVDIDFAGTTYAKFIYYAEDGSTYLNVTKPVQFDQQIYTPQLFEGGKSLQYKYAAKSHKHSMNYSYNKDTRILTITANDLV